MNAAAACHEIPGCPGCYVDAFRGHYLKTQTKKAEHIFILTHYHGDHYGSLPRGDDNKYEGPATIHCTPVTAALLRNVHGVPAHLVVEHAYGATWTFRPTTSGPRKRKAAPSIASSSASSASFDDNGKDDLVKITFYDANHCPGAAIVLFERPDGRALLHTGDMRYHEKMKSYPRLRDAALQRRMDVVFLDTTYANPRHNFVPQETAVEAIAGQVQDLLSLGEGDNHGNQRSCGSKTTTTNHRSTSTLVLLSCYSIGKERVLWEASIRSNQFVFVQERKHCMLQCIQEKEQHQQRQQDEQHQQQQPQQHVSSRIVQRCTLDATESDIHVIPMGLAGEMWPFFQPNHWACADYARKQAKAYDRVVAFMPTGWAEASNWNKKNTISRRECDGLQVEIRLVGYSEHSSFSELQEFVAFLRPRKIIPTVFKDESDMRKIQARFKVDAQRTKQFFLESFGSPSATTTTTTSTDLSSPPSNSNVEVGTGSCSADRRSSPGKQQGVAAKLPARPRVVSNSKATKKRPKTKSSPQAITKFFQVKKKKP